MISDSVKLAKIKARAERDVKTLELVKSVASNPAVELLLSAFILIEMRKAKLFDGLSGNLEEAALMGLIAGCVGLQQVAPLAPYIAQGQESLAKAIPGLLAIGAGG